MKNIDRLIFISLLCFILLFTGCGDDKDIIGVKEGTLAYSRFDQTGIIEKIDGAPQIGKAFDKAFKDPEWKIEEEQGKKFVVFSGTIEQIGEKPQRFTFAFLNKGEYYSLASIDSKGEFYFIYAIMKSYSPEYDFTRNNIPPEVIKRLIPEK